jgi:hypothetical protein
MMLEDVGHLGELRRGTTWPVYVFLREAARADRIVSQDVPAFALGVPRQQRRL